MATNNNTYAGIKAQQTAELKEINNTYNPMIKNSDKFYNQQINAAKDYQKTQTDIQNQMTDQVVKEINQNKEYQRQDYLKEQKGAYADWQKQSNQYGANAEANAKMIGSGYAESSQVQMYTAYQNRVATARQTYTRAITDYDNKIADARLQNNAKLAEIAYTTLQKTLELSLQGFQYKNTLLQQRLGERQKVKQNYYTRWSDLRSYLLQKAQFEEQKREFNKSFNRGSGGGSSISYKYKDKNPVKLKKKVLKEKSKNKTEVKSVKGALEKRMIDLKAQSPKVYQSFDEYIKTLGK